jgi:hypothetical protein
MEGGSSSDNDSSSGGVSNRDVSMGGSSRGSPAAAASVATMAVPRVPAKPLWCGMMRMNSIWLDAALRG